MIFYSTANVLRRIVYQQQAFIIKRSCYYESFPVNNLFSILTVKVSPLNVLPYMVYLNYRMAGKFDGEFNLTL